MVSANGISRRHMLAISAAGGIALANSRVARAQAAKRIDQFAPELDKIVSTAEPILELATGFGGGGNTEGPVWWKEGGYLLFNSIGENRRIKYTPGQGTIVAKEPTNVDWLVLDQEEERQRLVSYGRDPAIEIIIRRDAEVDFRSVVDALSSSIQPGLNPATAECTDRVEFPGG